MMKFYAFLFLSFISLSLFSQQNCTLPTEPTTGFANSCTANGTGNTGTWTNNGDWGCGNIDRCNFLGGSIDFIIANNNIRTYNCTSQNLNLPTGSRITIYEGSTLQFNNDPSPSTIRNITINSGSWITVAGLIRGVDPGDDPTITVKSGGVLYVTCTGRVVLGESSTGVGSLIVEAGGKVFIECGGKITIRSNTPETGELTNNGAICKAPTQGRYSSPIQTTACAACSGSNKAEIDVDANTVVSGAGNVGNEVLRTGWSTEKP